MSEPLDASLPDVPWWRALGHAGTLRRHASMRLASADAPPGITKRDGGRLEWMNDD